MKKKILILIFLVNPLFGQSHYIYKLFDNKVQSVFPSQAGLLDTSNISIIEQKGLKVYIYADKKNKLSFTAKLSSSGLEYNVNKYTKKFLDNLYKSSFETFGVKLTSFSSKKNNDQYIFYYSYKSVINDVAIYNFSKTIIFEKKRYTWTISSLNLNAKTLFKQYKDSIKIIK